MKSLIFLLLIFFTINVTAQSPYVKVQAWQKKYISKHGVVKGADKKYIRFFPIDTAFYVSAKVSLVTDTIGFEMATTAGTNQHFYKYGKLDFLLSGKPYSLYMYKSKELMQTAEYKDYLFIPFTDVTNGTETYKTGRYLEYFSTDFKNGKLYLDFNGAYNPYCAYANGFHCPIPPKENKLGIAVRAGEKNFAKNH
jgi:uncharacterized protein (DUF1684 family)